MEVFCYSLAFFLIMILIIFLVARGTDHVEKTYKRDIEDTAGTYEAEEFRNALFKDLNVEVKEENRDRNEYVVCYQGGNFTFCFSEDNGFLKLSYPGFYEFKYEKYGKALRALNSVNLKHYWTTSFAYYSNSENPIVANCDYLCALHSTPKKSAEILKYVLNMPFSIARDFHDEMNRLNEKYEICVAELTKDIMHKMQYDNLRLQLDNINEEFKNSTPEKMTVAHLLKLSKEVDFGCMLSMRIIQGERVDTMTEQGAILSFDFEDYIKEKHNEYNRFTFLLDFEKESLAIDIQKMPGSNSRHLIYNMAVVQNGSYRQDRCTPYNFRTLLNVHLTTKEEDDWEARYMLEETCDNAPYKEYLPCVDQHIHFSLYWGVRLYNNGAYLQALEHLKKVYHSISDPTEKTSTQAFCFVSEMIGSIYMKLGMPETAYTYIMPLAMVMNVQHCYPLFAECLSAINEIAALDWMFKMRDSIIDTLNNGECNTDNTINTYFFINRKIVGQLIKREKKNEAKNFLENMINHDEDVEWARTALANLNVPS